MLAKRTQRFIGRLKEEVLPEWDFAQMGSVFWMSRSKINRSFPPDITADDKKSYATFFVKALEAGVYFAPSPFEVGFVSTAHTDEVLDASVEKLKKCLK